MKRFIIIVFLLFISGGIPFACQGQILNDSIWNKNIKSVFLTQNGVDGQLPILQLNGNDHLHLSFDLLNSIGESFHYRIIHCDRDWKQDNLEPYEYISGFEEGPIDNFKNSFTTLQDYTYYYDDIPSNGSAFIASGNYIIVVFPQDYPDSIVLTRRFIVYENLSNIEISIGKPTGSYGNIQTDQDVSISLGMNDDSQLSTIQQYLSVYLRQNQRKDLFRTIPFYGFQNNRLVYSFNRENVFPAGNCFRFFDMSNLRTPMYNVQRIETYAGETFAFLRPDEARSKNAFSLTKSLNGGMKVNIWDRKDPQIEADYAWVTFSLPMQQPFLNGSIYLVGDITQWQLNDESKMEWNPQYKAYTKRLLLKQGYYSYQYIFLEKGAKEGETKTIEGDHYQMSNDYYVYVYSRTPIDRYDRLIGFKHAIAQ